MDGWERILTEGRARRRRRGSLVLPDGVASSHAVVDVDARWGGFELELDGEEFLFGVEEMRPRDGGRYAAEGLVLFGESSARTRVLVGHDGGVFTEWEEYRVREANAVETFLARRAVRHPFEVGRARTVFVVARWDGFRERVPERLRVVDVATDDIEQYWSGDGVLAFNSVVRSRFPGSTHFIARPDALVGLVAALVCSAKDITALKVLIEPASRENVAPVEMERLASAHRVGTRFPRLSEGYGQGGTVWLDAERGTITQETRDEQRGIYWLISADPSTLREWRLALR